MLSQKAFLLLTGSALSLSLAQAQSLRPPAYPLLTHNPYFSVWAFRDELASAPTRHWTGEPQSLEGVVRVDGQAYQFMGQAGPQYRADPPPQSDRPSCYCPSLNLQGPASLSLGHCHCLHWTCSLLLLAH